MDWRAKVELYEQIRRVYEFGVGSVIGMARKQELGLALHETFVPQSYDWGVEAQVDWYEAYADLDGERVKLYVFSMRSMRHTTGEAVDIGSLSAYERPLPTMIEYDQLFSVGLSSTSVQAVQA